MIKFYPRTLSELPYQISESDRADLMKVAESIRAFFANGKYGVCHETFTRKRKLADGEIIDCACVMTGLVVQDHCMTYEELYDAQWNRETGDAAAYEIVRQAALMTHPSLDLTASVVDGWTNEYVTPRPLYDLLVSVFDRYKQTPDQIADAIVDLAAEPEEALP